MSDTTTIGDDLMATEAERTALWNQWLKTDEGKGYEAGWGDYHNRILAQKGKTWVAERLLERAEAEVERLTEEFERYRAAAEVPTDGAARRGELEPRKEG